MCVCEYIHVYTCKHVFVSMCSFSSFHNFMYIWFPNHPSSLCLVYRSKRCSEVVGERTCPPTYLLLVSKPITRCYSPTPTSLWFWWDSLDREKPLMLAICCSTWPPQDKLRTALLHVSYMFFFFNCAHEYETGNKMFNPLLFRFQNGCCAVATPYVYQCRNVPQPSGHQMLLSLFSWVWYGRQLNSCICQGGCDCIPCKPMLNVYYMYMYMCM